MKKIMFALAVVACAVMAKASTMEWQFVGSEAVNGLTVYAFTQALASPTVDAIKAATSSGTIGKNGRQYDTKGSLDGYAKNQSSETVYLYVLDAKGENYYAATATGVTYTPGTTDLPGNGIYENKDIAASGTGWAKVAGGQDTPEPSPEPTSAMLLLVGAAVTALRRRRV